MTKQQQVKKDTPKAVELNKAALDQAAGGAGSDFSFPIATIKGESRVFSTPGTGVLKAT